MTPLSSLSRKICSLLLGVLGAAVSCAADPRSADWFYNPFSKDSAHHRPIGKGAVYTAPDHPATVCFQQGNAFNINVGNRPWGCGIWEAKPDDPLFTVTHEALDGEGRASEFPVWCRLPLNMIMEQRRNAGGNFDGVLVVYDRANDTVHHFRQFNWQAATPTPVAKPTAGSHRTWSIRGAAHQPRLGEAVGTSASGVAAMFGILRGWEVKAAGHRIGHGRWCCPGGRIICRAKSCSPAKSGGRLSPWMAPVIPTQNDNTGLVPYGSLWAIPPIEKGGPDLAKLVLSEMGMRLAECLRDYGAYAVDGGNATALRADQDFDDNLAKELKAQTALFYKYLRLVVNSVPDVAVPHQRVGRDPRHRRPSQSFGLQ